MWIALAICSAALLGVYDIFKKVSVRNNAVIPVLAVSVCLSFIILTPLLLLSRANPDLAKEYSLFVPQIDLKTHFHIMVKSIIVLGSWISAYFGMKHVPITIYAPVRATQPIWTVVGAFIIFAERFSPLQALGVSLTLICFFFFSVVGKREGISWKSNKWMWLIILATLLGCASGLYDKHLMRSFDRMAVQVFSTMYQTLAMLIVTFCVWYPQRAHSTPFSWRWSIVGISIFLIISDYLYFWALSEEDAMISIISTIRRSGAVLPFLYGAFMLRERNLMAKSLLLLGVLFGIFLLYLGRN